MTDRDKTSRLGLTPSQTIGPFFAYGLTPSRYGRTEFVTHDLTLPAMASEAIIIEGRLLDGDGLPVADGMIEIWQADEEGRYAHPIDTLARGNTGFTGFGRTETDANGAFSFVTIKPGSVPGPDGTLQAPHISVGIFARGLLNRLHTRIYFGDESSNAADPILTLMPEEARKTLIAELAPGERKRFRIDIRLQGEGETVFFDC